MTQELKISEKAKTFIPYLTGEKLGVHMGFHVYLHENRAYLYPPQSLVDVGFTVGVASMSASAKTAPLACALYIEQLIINWNQDKHTSGGQPKPTTKWAAPGDAENNTLIICSETQQPIVRKYCVTCGQETA